MVLCDINPFLRYAELQPSVLSSAPLSCSYDYRIFYILDGTATLVLSDRRIPLSKGMLIYLRPGTPYYFEGQVKVLVLNFDMTRNQAEQKKPRKPSKDIESFFEDQVFENDPPLELSTLTVIPEAFEIEGKLQDCLLHFSYPTAFSDAFTSAIVKDLLCYVARNATKQSELPDLVQKITLYIRNNYDQELSNTQISTAFGYHPFYLNRIFKNSTGITMHQAVIQEKMRIAKHLLKGTDLSIAAVAEEVGFSDRSQFCTAFRKYSKNTPTEYRKKNK